MYQTINKSQFRDAFLNMNRQNNFSYEGLGELFDYLEENFNDCNNGKGLELDVIALCCEFTEYDSLDDYNADNDPVESIDDIEDVTIVIRINDDSFIIQS